MLMLFLFALVVDSNIDPEYDVDETPKPVEAQSDDAGRLLPTHATAL